MKSGCSPCYASCPLLCFLLLPHDFTFLFRDWSFTAKLLLKLFFFFTPVLSANRSDLRMNFGSVHETTRTVNLVTKAVAVSVVTQMLLILVLAQIWKLSPSFRSFLHHWDFRQRLRMIHPPLKLGNISNLSPATYLSLHIISLSAIVFEYCLYFICWYYPCIGGL